MDAYGHLKGLGWRGEGHSLDTSNRGLRKPLLVSHRTNNSGLGHKEQKQKQADQWWLNAFDNALRDIGTGKQSALAQIREHGVNRGGLYGFFVRGEGLQGTLDDSAASETPSEIVPVDSSTTSASTSVSESRSEITTMSRSRFSGGGRQSKKSSTGANLEPLGVNNAREARAEKRKREEEQDEPVIEQPEEKKVKVVEQPEKKTAKVIDAIEIPVPQPIIREKKKKGSAKEIRDRRKEERQEKAKLNAIENKQKAIEEGTWDYEAEQQRQKEHEVERRVKQELRRRENAGEFGPVLPHPSILLKYEKEVDKELRKMGETGNEELHKKMMHEKVNVPGLDPNKKIKYKEQKYKREKLKREAKREIKARLRAEMLGEEYVPESELTKEEIEAKKQEEKAKLKQLRRENRAKKEEKEAEKQAEKEKKLEEKKLRREMKKESRKKTAEAVAAMKAEKEAAATNGKDEPDVFAGGADEIKLGINVDGRTRTIPGVGKVGRYPTQAEKKQKKLECRAYEAGMSVEDYKALLDKEKEEKEAPEKQRVAELQASRGGLNSKQWFRYCWLAQSESQEAAEKYFLEIRKKNAEKLTKTAEGEVNGKSSNSENAIGSSSISDMPTNFPRPDRMEDENTFAGNESKPLSEKKRRKYEAKAAEKGITVEEYIAKKEAKEAKRASKTSGSDDSTAVLAIVDPVQINGHSATAMNKSGETKTNGIAAPHKITKAPPGSLADKLLTQAKSIIASAPTENGATTETEAAGFVVDTDGDPHLNNTKEPTEDLGFVVDASGDPDILTRPKPVLIWNPDMLGDRKVKELSKEERHARLVWLRERRAARHAAEGKTPLSKKERHKARVEKKQKQRNRLVHEIMTEKGKPREDVSKEELEDARRAAKRVMREMKREKRNKVIHRKKLGGGLRGQFGGSISMGGRA